MGEGAQSSYKIGEASFRDVSAELERLRIQADANWAREVDALARHGLRHDAEILEAGCGPGFVTGHLVDFADAGSVTGLDVDETMLEHARALLAGSDRARFVQATATDTGLPDDAYDVVLARFLLQHLPDVPAVLAELRRVLRPGGRLVVVEADDAFSLLFDPEPGFMRELLDGVVEEQRSHGGDRYIGRKLPRLLRDAGYGEIAVDAVVTHTVVSGRESVRGVIPDQALDHLEEVRAITPELAEEARDYLRRIDSGEQPFEGMLTTIVVSGAA